MRTSVAGLALVATMAMAASPAAAQGFRIGNWQIRPVGIPGSLQVSCLADTHQGGNIALELESDVSGRLWLSANSPQWRLSPGRPIGTFVTVDQTPRQSIVGQIVESNAVRYELSAEEALSDRLRAGRRMAIQAGGVTVSFRLDEMGEVIDRVRRCTAEGAAAARSADGAADSPPDDLARRIEADANARAARRSGGPMPIPTASWPSAQQQRAPMPVASTRGEPLSAQELFRLAAPSVYLVWVDQGTRFPVRMFAMGSAVAISHDTLVTNCHVVRGAYRIELRKGRTIHDATILNGDPRSDRCLLRVNNVQLRPVRGVRAMASITVGERAFTIGNPSGLESTLGEGIVSGLRQASGVRIIQTTAPMSPGSSGGGLFDAWGNLIGVPTFLMRAPADSDIFRFAIAADEYWK